MDHYAIHLHPGHEFLHGVPFRKVTAWAGRTADQIAIDEVAALVKTMLNNVDKGQKAVADKRFGCSVRGAKFFADSPVTLYHELAHRASSSPLFSGQVELTHGGKTETFPVFDPATTHWTTRVKFLPVKVLSMSMACALPDEFEATMMFSPMVCLDPIDKEAYGYSHRVSGRLTSNDGWRGVEYPSVRHPATLPPPAGQCVAVYHPDTDVTTVSGMEVFNAP